jgi:2-polyprenyl-3-methyl-5-hydroxy-6-metoxy-1,4-benzoquinol methylase
MIINNELVYDKKRVGDISQLGSETTKVLNWVDQGCVVLELGCHTGHLSEWLQKKGCSVTGVDLNERALQIADPYLERKILADLEKETFWEQIEGTKFKHILCMHVLEHLSNPWETLDRLSGYLEPKGEIIIALPNINNAKDRFNIFFGEFNYTVDGVMDKTHLRFFNQKTARELIDQAGLEIVDYYSPWQVNPFHHFIDHLPLIWRLKGMFKMTRVPWFFRNKRNLTDVVMLFRCRKKVQ